MKTFLITITFVATLSIVKAQQTPTPPPKPKDPDSEVAIDASSNPSAADSSKIYTTVERIPEFPGGMTAFYKFIMKNLVVPENASGKVYVNFVVEKDGALSGINVVKPLTAEANAEAIRVMMKSPKWNPGIQNGRPVRVSYTLPIEFQ